MLPSPAHFVSRPALSRESLLSLFSIKALELLAVEVKCISVEHSALPASHLGRIEEVCMPSTISLCAGTVGACQSQREAARTNATLT